MMNHRGSQGAHGAHHDHAHPHRERPRRSLGVFWPHRHGHAHGADPFLATSKEATRALLISMLGLFVTAAVQATVVVLSGSVGLLADTVHNIADATTALPLGVAFFVSRRPPTDRYTYGFGRSEDLAGLAVVAVIAFSLAIAAWEAVGRIIHPQTVTHLWAVAAAGLVGFAGNAIVARYRIRVGRRIGSAALVADGRHAQADGFTSLAVVAGAIGVAAGWRLADPIVGLAISAALMLVLWRAARDIFGRLMDSTDAAIVTSIRRLCLRSQDVLAVDRIRARWIGCELHAEMTITVSPAQSVRRAHEIAESVHHSLLHEFPRLRDVTIHTDPATTPSDPDPHALTAHHLSGPALATHSH